MDGTLERLSDALIEPLSLDVKKHFDAYSRNLLSELPKAIKLESEGKPPSTIKKMVVDELEKQKPVEEEKKENPIRDVEI